MARAVTVLDYGTGNLQSVRRALVQAGGEPTVTSDPDVLRKSERVVLPGVGHFARAIEHLRESHLIDALEEAVRQRGTPVLGICLGMQLMARRSEEGNVAGLGWIDAEVVRLRVTDSMEHKVPHVGWNSATPLRPSRFLGTPSAEAEYYFIHAYHVVCATDEPVLCRTQYAQPFTSALEQDNIVGVQFHPEKSRDAGAHLLAAFMRH